MPAPNKEHQAGIKESFYRGLTQAATKTKLDTKFGGKGPAKNTIENAWKKLRAEAAEKFAKRTQWEMDEVKTLDIKDLKGLLWDQLGKNSKVKVSMVREQLLVQLENSGIVGRRKADFKLLQNLNADEKKDRSRNLKAKTINNVTEDQLKLRAERAEKRDTEREDAIRRGLYGKGETEREQDLAEYQSILNASKNGTFDMKRLRFRLTQRCGNDYDPTSMISNFSAEQMKCFMVLLNLLRNYVDSIGMKNFHGSTEYVWNARTWLSIIIRIVQSIESYNFSYYDCWTSNRISTTTLRPTICVSCDGVKKTCNIAKIMCLLQNGSSEFDGLHASHLCHNNVCVSPYHIIWETGFENEDRSGCQHGAAFLCPHRTDPCIFVDSTGEYLPCKNDSTQTTCICCDEVDCFGYSAQIPHKVVRFQSSRFDYSTIDEKLFKTDTNRLFVEMFDRLLSDVPNWNRLPAALTKKSSVPKALFDSQTPVQQQAFKVMISLLERLIWSRLQNNENLDLVWSARDSLFILLHLSNITMPDDEFSIKNCWTSNLQRDDSGNGRPQLFLNGQPMNAARVSSTLSANIDGTAIAKIRKQQIEKMSASHLCSNILCVNPFHLIFETHEVNISRKKCVYGAASLCPHDVKCVYQKLGVYQICKSDPKMLACECDLNCF